MNRKNLTAAVLAGLAGAAGIAGTAQAVNINPDGLGQVLIYPYFTTNDGNATVLSVVNTTDQAKAVKVRFLEGFNSREVLDFNLYMSHHDVWTAVVFDDDGTPSMATSDTSCTVPDIMGGYPGPAVTVPFLDYAYTGKEEDGGPTSIQRAGEGYMEIIEMGTLFGGGADDWDKNEDTAGYDATHWFQEEEDEDGKVIDEWWGPNNCEGLSDRWDAREPSKVRVWYNEVRTSGYDSKARTDTMRNSGGLFGGAAVVNSDNGTMFSYDAIALQGYDKTRYGVHYEPGQINPSLNDGSESVAYIFFGAPTNEAREFDYTFPVQAISATFMQEHIMNEYITDELVAAATEWVVTFPTKAYHVDPQYIEVEDSVWTPDPDDPGCGWVPGNDNPLYKDNGQCDSSLWSGCPNTDPNDSQPIPGWEQCTFIEVDFVFNDIVKPFTDAFDGEACETYTFEFWDREEGPDSIPGGPGGPIFSPPPPDIPGTTLPANEFCYEVNVLRFGTESIFGTPEIDGATLLTEVDLPTTEGWARIGFNTKWASGSKKGQIKNQDYVGLVGLPVTGFAANEYENEFLGGGDVKAFYGGLFKHKGNVRRTWPDTVPRPR